MLEGRVGISVVWLRISASAAFGQAMEFMAVRAEVDFSEHVRLC